MPKETEFQFGYSDEPGTTCPFCDAVNGEFCLSLAASVECLEYRQELSRVHRKKENLK